MKRFVYFLSALMIIISIAGCNRDDFLDSQKPQKDETEQVPVNTELSNEELAEIVAKSLGVPDKLSIEYDVSEMYFWDASERYFKNITFTENGETVATASVDPYSGELIRNIFKYDN